MKKMIKLLRIKSKKHFFLGLWSINNDDPFGNFINIQDWSKKINWKIA